MLTNSLKIFGSALALISLLLSIETAYAHDLEDYGVGGESQINGDVSRYAFGLAIDSLGEAHVCYVQASNPNNLIHATAGDGWAGQSVAENLSSSDECALAINSDDELHIVYTKKSTNELKHAKYVGGVWVTTTIDDNYRADVINPTNTNTISFAISPLGRTAVAYYDGTARDLRFAEYSDGVWNSETLVSEGDQGAWPALAFDADEDAVISFVKNFTTTPELWLIEEQASVWQAASLFDNNGTSVGTYNHLKADGAGRLHISYYATHADEGKLLRYRFRDEADLWSDALDVTEHNWENQNGVYNSLAVDPDGNAFLLHNWEYASALFGHTSYLNMVSVYFTPEVGADNAPLDEFTVAYQAGTNYRFVETQIAIDADYNAYAAWVEIIDGQYTLQMAKVSTWKPAITLLTPNAENNESAADAFTFEWLDFDPDSNAYLRFKWLDEESWTYSVFGDVLREDDLNQANISVADLNEGSITVYAEISNVADFSSDVSYGTATANVEVTHPVVEDDAEEVADDAPVDDDEPEADDPEDEDEAEVNPLREDGQSNSDEIGENNTGNDTQDQLNDLLATAASAGCSLNVQPKNNPVENLFILSVFVVTALFRLFRFKFRNACRNKIHTS